MSKRARIGTLVAGVLFALLVAPAFVPASAQLVQQEGNLLVNPGFEGLSCPSGTAAQAECNATHEVHIKDGIIRDNIRTPEGWVTWWLEDPMNGWTQPEVVIAAQIEPYLNPPRIRTGSYAMKVFGSHGAFDGGFYQVVTGLRPGATVALSVYAHTWTCSSFTDGDNGPATTCGDRWAMPLTVGIEPNGVADPWAPSIVWSGEYYHPDTFGLVGPVTAQVGPAGNVCVYLRSWSKWATRGGNDTYWDDAALVYASPPAPTKAPQPTATAGPSPTPAPTSTPRPTSTPHPDGAVVHIVEAGDTLSLIAEKYRVTEDQIRELNAGSIGKDDLVRVGQELVISIPPTATPTPEPTSTLAPATNTPPPTVAPTETPVISQTPTPQATEPAEPSSGGTPTGLIIGVFMIIVAAAIAGFYFSRRKK